MYIHVYYIYIYIYIYRERDWGLSSKLWPPPGRVGKTLAGHYSKLQGALVSNQSAGGSTSRTTLATFGSAKDIKPVTSNAHKQ